MQISRLSLPVLVLISSLLVGFTKNSESKNNYNGFTKSNIVAENINFSRYLIRIRANYSIYPPTYKVVLVTTYANTTKGANQCARKVYELNTDFKTPSTVTYSCRDHIR